MSQHNAIASLTGNLPYFPGAKPSISTHGGVAFQNLASDK